MTFKKLPLILLISATCGLLLQSCTSGPLEGDWFPCEDEACTRLDDDGIRFTADDRWSMIDVDGSSYEAGEPIRMEEARGDYSFDGDHVTLSLDGSSEQRTFKVEFDGDDMLLYVESSSSQSTCSAPQGGPVHCDKQPPRTEIQPLRFKRVGEASPVPVTPNDWTRNKEDTPQPVPPPPDSAPRDVP